MFFKRNKSGVTRIVRDTYRKKPVSGAVKENWWSIRKRVLERDNHCCVQCKKPENPKAKIWLDVHHILELSAGGLTVMSNLISLCRNCHERRHSHMRRH
jgi:5-methylcytosine-specific restriction endonuclease McrA